MSTVYFIHKPLSNLCITTNPCLKINFINHVYLFIYPISPPICILKFVDKNFIDGAVPEKALECALFKKILNQIFIFEYFSKLP